MVYKQGTVEVCSREETTVMMYELRANGNQEKLVVLTMVGELVVELLWNSRAYEASASTNEHHIRVWKEDEVVRAEVRRMVCGKV